MKTFPYRGQNLSIREIAELPEVNLSESSLYWRLVKKGESVEDALKYGYNKSMKHLWKGRMLTSYRIAQDKDVHVSHSTIIGRLRRGWDIQKAAFTPTESQQKNSPVKPMSVINSPENIHGNKTSEREQIKLIMSVPINPKKCRYTAHGGSL